METDTLSELLIDGDELNTTRIVKTLKPYIGIDSNSGDPILLPEFESMTAEKKVIAYLLARKVSYLLEMTSNEEVAPKQIIEQTGIPGGTVRPALKSLREKRMVSQKDQGDYFIAGHQINSVINKLK